MLKFAACCGFAAVGVDALVVEPGWLDVTERDVPVPDLPQALEGFRIAQLSDLHLSSLGGLEAKVLAAIRERDVRLVAITGDAIESSSAFGALSELVREITRDRSVQVIATMGNWEHWGGVGFEALATRYKDVGGLLFGNEGHLLSTGVLLVATDDHCVGNADLGTALRATPNARAPRILLTHAPGHLDHPPEGAPRFHLCLAGHTHGGQVRPGFAPWTPPGSGRFVSGHYDTPAGPAYVSRGIGTSVLGARLLCRPELPIFRLVRA